MKATIIASTLAAAAAAAAPARFIFTFGDSYSTTGFSPLLLNAQTAPNPGNPLGNPAYPGATTSGGENWADLLTTRLSPAGTVAYDFAQGGAAIDNVLRYPQTSATIPDLRTQIAQFALAAGTPPATQAYAPWSASNSAVLIFMGINDLVSELTFPPYATLNSTFIAAELASYTADLTLLYALGARRFVLAAVPPIYRTPLLTPPPFNTTARPAVDAFNAQLAQTANSFKAAHPDVKLTLYDSTAAYNAILDAPEANGAPNNMCYNADGSTCLWWDAFHPGMAIHRAMAAGFHDALAGIGFYA